jgi:hypothetical protein
MALLYNTLEMLLPYLRPVRISRSARQATCSSCKPDSATSLVDFRCYIAVLISFCDPFRSRLSLFRLSDLTSRFYKHAISIRCVRRRLYRLHRAHQHRHQKPKRVARLRHQIPRTDSIAEEPGGCPCTGQQGEAIEQRLISRSSSSFYTVLQYTFIIRTEDEQIPAKPANRWERQPAQRRPSQSPMGSIHQGRHRTLPGRDSWPR